MASQGPLFPGTVTTESVLPEDDNDWVNPSNIGANDGSEATITAATYDANDISFRLKAQNFGFTIPDGATIDGIVVEIEQDIAAGAAQDNRVQLLDAAGALVGSNKATASAWPSSPTIATYGGSADTWSASPTPAMVNDPDFGVVLSVLATAANTDIGVDFIRVTVHYTPTNDRRAHVTFAEVEVPDGTGANRFTSSGSQSATIAASPDYNSTYTIGGWVRFTDVAAQHDIFGVELDGNNFDAVYLNSSGVINFRVSVAGAITTVGSLSASAGTWYYVAIVRRSATEAELYIGTTPAGIAQNGTDNTRDVTARGAADTTAVGRVAGGGFMNGRYNAIKVWTRALSLADLQTEADYWTPFDATNEWASWRMDDPTTGIEDSTSNNRDLTVTNGPLTEEKGLSLQEVVTNPALAFRRKGLLYVPVL